MPIPALRPRLRGKLMFDFLKQRANNSAAPSLPDGTQRRRYVVKGQVQGVGFRYRAQYAARSLGLTGWVRNEDDGSVTLEVQGSPDNFGQLFAMIQRSDYILITDISETPLAVDPWERSFAVRGY